VRQREALVDRHNVRDAVARVENDTGGAPGRVEGQHRLDGHVERGSVERLEHDLRHFLPVGLGIERRLGEEDGVLLRRDAQLIVEGVVPDLLHVVPVSHNPMFDGILQGKDATLCLGFITGYRRLI
jgi:hypothetical protein